MTNQHTKIAIIGGGLTGLTLAYRLRRAGQSFVLFEARDRLGGRILAGKTSDTNDNSYDLGPAWIWRHNERTLRLLRELGLATFEQYANGNLVFQDASGDTRRDLEFATMAGSLRLDGGLGQLVRALNSKIPVDAIRTRHIVGGVETSQRGVEVHGHISGDTFCMKAERVVIALPPRVAAASLHLPSNLTVALQRKFRAIPTWMAGHAKFIAVYHKPFWRDAGLSGDAVSHAGPMAEIHDASPFDASEGALFGFLGIDAATRHRLGAQTVMQHCIAQLVALFGADARYPKHTFWKDWAQDDLTATEADWTPPDGHPGYGTPSELAMLPSDQVLFAGTELAPRDGGFLEGAVISGETTAETLLRNPR